MVEMNDFDLATVEGIDEAIKALRETRKAVKAEATKAAREAAKEEKARLIAEAKEAVASASLNEGDAIRVILKGDEVIGDFVKMTEARIVVLVDGEKKTLPFDKFIGVADAEREQDTEDSNFVEGDWPAEAAF